jgi:DNA-binding SARP family transcriptional activator/TolB-like protein
VSKRGNARGTDSAGGAGTGLRVQMLGTLGIWRDGLPVALPASRKLRALFAYLALAPRPQGRSQLCELLWEGPSDPRGELRWCLSRIRGAIDEPERRRVVTEADTVALDLSGDFVDAALIPQAARDGIDTLSLQRQRELADLFHGDFLEGLNIDDSPAFDSWLTGRRRRLRGSHAALLEQLAARVPDEEALGYLEKWLQLAPFDRRVHERLLGILARTGRLREAEEHVAAAAALFDAEGLDWTSLRDAWRSARAGHPSRSAGSVIVEPQPVPGQAASEALPSPSRRASIAVMPFADESPAPGERGGAADALAHDVTTRLAKLRSMFVIAQGSTFALHERRVGPEEAGRMLNVDYVVSGGVRVLGARLRIRVELVESRTARIVWSEILNHDAGDTFQVLDEIGDRIVASVAGEIETIERNRAILLPPNSLDAWESHHRGLWHMYRFTREDNARAQHLFESAVRLDPTFARAYAGLSFAHFQNAFQGWVKGADEIDRAYAAAGHSLMVDDRDPAAHWAMGRALWLRGSNEQAVSELERAVDLSPNFALGHYALAFVQSQSGDADAAIARADCSRNLSPFDPLLFGMLGARAMALIRLGRFEEAAEWAVKAAARPNAHPHIFAIAAFTLALAGALDEARTYAAAVRRILPQYGFPDFRDAFRFDDLSAALFRKGAKVIGMA